jgi:hypothetical protein
MSISTGKLKDISTKTAFPPPSTSIAKKIGLFYCLLNNLEYVIKMCRGTLIGKRAQFVPGRRAIKYDNCFKPNYLHYLTLLLLSADN